VLDDASRAMRARELYASLLREKVDLLIGPYGSAATLLAAGEAERARRVMVNGAGPSAVVHSRPGRYVFQTAVPYSAYGLDVLQVAEAAEARRLFIVARDDAASREMAEAARNAALGANGFAVGEIELYRPGTTDFAPPVAKARGANADAWIAFGDVRDAAEMVKSFKRLDYAPPLFFASAASHPRFIALLGQDAEWSLGAVDFDARVGDAARAFAKKFMARYTVPPQLAAAEGYTAGEVLAAAVRRAGSLEQEKIRASLASLELATMFGEYRVNPENGAQTGFKPVVVQIRKGRPEPGTPLLPYPQWNERALIK
jgi:branched-chain amino acid transport system substrate-binding protein